nr:reverse transcriptase domain-containing protein [Tanacetum cinerariifolium]
MNLKALKLSNQEMYEHAGPKLLVHKVLENQLLSVSLLICLGKRDCVERIPSGNSLHTTFPPNMVDPLLINLFNDEASSSNNTKPKPPTPPKTLLEHSHLISSDFQNPITFPTKQTRRIVDSRDIWLIQNICTFQGLRTKDLLYHVKHYLSIVDNIQADRATRDTSRLRFFHFSLKGKATEWLDRIPTPYSSYDVGSARVTIPRSFLSDWTYACQEETSTMIIPFQDSIRTMIPHHEGTVNVRKNEKMAPNGLLETSNPPFPSRLKKQKKDDEDERLLSIFKQIHINLPFFKAIIHMPKGAKVLKDLLSHKEKLEKAASSVKLNEECSAIIQKSLPQKEGDPGLIYPISNSLWVSPVQIPITLEDQEKTTFTCPYRTFAYKGMLFGLCNAPATSFNHCLKNLENMLKRCEETNLILNWEKCHFMLKEGIILGHKVSSFGIEVDKAKIKVISKLPYPTNVKAIRSFLGHAGFYRRFIKDFSQIARPMTQLLVKDAPFNFFEECIQAFNMLKPELTQAPIMIKPDWSLPFEIMCDVSDYALGAVLGQRIDKYFKPIHYASKTINDTGELHNYREGASGYCVCIRQIQSIPGLIQDHHLYKSFCPAISIHETKCKTTPNLMDLATSGIQYQNP